MAINLRSKKDLEEWKKNSNEEEQPENRNEEDEIEERESKIEKGEAEVNNMGEKQKSDQVVSEKITFPDNSPAYTPLSSFPP